MFNSVARSHDHPTAEEIFRRTRAAVPDISFATVYNCLSALVQCGLVRQVTLLRSPARYCPNMREHCHFFCETCGKVTDIDLISHSGVADLRLPAGFQVSSCDLSLRGICPACAGASHSASRS